MSAIYLHLNRAGLHYIVISAVLGHPPDARLYLYFHLKQNNENAYLNKVEMEQEQNFVNIE